jgi:hypothetical protein
MSADKFGLLEVRMGGGGGAQTIFPPSTHVSGEPIKWESGHDEIRGVDGAVLLACASQLAAASQLAIAYPKVGGRHDASFVLGGFLTRCGFAVPRIKLFVEAVAVASGQPLDKRRDMIRTAEDGAGSGRQAGFHLLAETFGKDAAKKCAEWLGYQQSDSKPESEPFYRESLESKPPFSRVVGAGTFLRSYEPISYTVDGILPSGYLYGITAKQGSGKTAFMIAASTAVAIGNNGILGCEVEKGRVAYVTIENPTDFKMKLAVNCYIHNISYDEAEPLIAIIDGRDTPEQIYEGLKLDAEENGQFQLVCFDTFQAGFVAANAGAFNDNEAVLAYVIRLRPLTTLPGQPSVLVAFHPVKNPTEDNLIPYGGGAILNEIDGNLTLWKEGQVKLYHNRLRGPEFDPRFFRIEMLSCEDIIDKKGRLILLPVMRPTTADDVEVKKAAAGDTNLALLKAIAADPKMTPANWAQTIGLSKQAVYKKLASLEKGKFVEKGANERWRLSKKGRAEVVTLAPEIDGN